LRLGLWCLTFLLTSSRRSSKEPIKLQSLFGGVDFWNARAGSQGSESLIEVCWEKTYHGERMEMFDCFRDWENFLWGGLLAWLETRCDLRRVNRDPKYTG
jgi:hypothetical protein